MEGGLVREKEDHEDSLSKEASMYMAIAVETSKHPLNQDDYKVWYLELSKEGYVIGLGVKAKAELIQSVFTNYKRHGKSNWRAFLKENDHSKEIEVFDFIARNMFENTHFGNLPTLNEFQSTLDSLEMNLEFKSIA